MKERKVESFLSFILIDVIAYKKMKMFQVLFCILLY